MDRLVSLGCALLLGLGLSGCESQGATSKPRHIEYSVGLMSGDPQQVVRVTYLGADGNSTVDTTTLPWSHSVTLDDPYLAGVQLIVMDPTGSYPGPHLHCVIRVDGHVNDEHFGTGYVQCTAKRT